MIFVGLAFAVWARLRIAGNWSSNVPLKHVHELIVDDPYGWARPGILPGFAGTALAVGEWRVVIGLPVGAAVFSQKLGLEEALLRKQSGGAYTEYANRIKALIPFAL